MKIKFHCSSFNSKFMGLCGSICAGGEADSAITKNSDFLPFHGVDSSIASATGSTLTLTGSLVLPPFFFFFCFGALSSRASRSGNYSLVLTTTPYGINSAADKLSILKPAAANEFPAALDSFLFSVGASTGAATGAN